MRSILAVDPSLACTGWAVFDNGQLSSAGIIPTKPRLSYRDRLHEVRKALPFSGGAPFDLLVLEWPQIYREKKQTKRDAFGNARRTDPNDLLWVAAVAGIVLTTVHATDVLMQRPGDWKGQVPKSIHNARVIARLSPPEREAFRRAGLPKSQEHNAIDAIGLGLTALGRMRRKEVPCEDTAGSGRAVAGVGIFNGAANQDDETSTIGSPAPRRNGARGG